MFTGRRAALWCVSCLILLAATGASLWIYFVHQIRRNEHAPRLERLHLPAEDFAFKTLDGTTKHLADFKGKTVFLDLWGTWCIQCVAEMPTVQALYDRHRRDPNFVFLIVSRMDSPAKVKAYAQRNGYTLPFYTMEDADIPRSMQLNQYPATFLFAPDGSLVARHVGAADWSAPAVDQLLQDTKRQR